MSAKSTILGKFAHLLQGQLGLASDDGHRVEQCHQAAHGGIDLTVLSVWAFVKAAQAALYLDLVELVSRLLR